MRDLTKQQEQFLKDNEEEIIQLDQQKQMYYLYARKSKDGVYHTQIKSVKAIPYACYQRDILGYGNIEFGLILDGEREHCTLFADCLKGTPFWRIHGTLYKTKQELFQAIKNSFLKILNSIRLDIGTGMEVFSGITDISQYKRFCSRLDLLNFKVD